MTLPDGERIRRATPDDGEALARLHIDCWDDAYTGLMPQRILDERRGKLDERAAKWREILMTSPVPTLLAVTVDGLVGFATAGPGRDHDMDLQLELWALYVRKERWGSGVGHALLREAVGDEPAYVWVLAGNDRAIRFYERQGFRRDGIEDEHPEGRHLRLVRR